MKMLFSKGGLLILDVHMIGPMSELLPATLNDRFVGLFLRNYCLFW